MKSKLLALLICMSSLQLMAQEITAPPKAKVNELGLGFRFPSQTSIDRNGVELLYKRWFHPWQAYRISAGFNNEQIQPAVWYKASNSQVIKTEKGGRNHFFVVSGAWKHNANSINVFIFSRPPTFASCWVKDPIPLKCIHSMIHLGSRMPI